jgi:hypothetical protein
MNGVDRKVMVLLGCREAMALSNNEYCPMFDRRKEGKEIEKLESLSLLFPPPH